MSNFLKTKAACIPGLLLSMVILTTVPRLASAQACPTAPESLGILVNTISISLTNAHQTSYAAIDRFADLLNRPKKLDVSYDGFIERILINRLITTIESYVPGLNLAQSTLLDYYEQSTNTLAAVGQNERLAAYDWVDREKAKIAKMYEFKGPAKLQCAYARAFAKLNAPDEQDKYLADLRAYSQQVEDSIPKEDRLLLDVLVHWVNANYQDRRQLSKGLLVLKVKAQGSETSKINLKLVGPEYTDKVARRLNALMAQFNLKPFDLKIRKLVLMRGTIERVASADVAFFLDKNNNFTEYPSYDNAERARGLYQSMMKNKFASYNTKFDN